MTRSLKVACALGIFIGLTGCPDPRSAPRDPKEIDTGAAEFLRSTPEVAKNLQKTEVSPVKRFRVQVLVDMSASMEGYVPTTVNLIQNGQIVPRNRRNAQATPTGVPDSNFFDLLRQLANEDELTEYLGFGTDKEGATTTFTNYGKSPPMVAGQYKRNYNDYADLLDQIAKLPSEADGEPIERVIITDGVQSNQDKGQGSALGTTVERLHAWVKKGGLVEIRLFTAPYAGTYYSEELRARNSHYSFSGKVENRPFLAISLISKKEDMPAWKKFWKRDALAELKQEGNLSYPAQQIAVTGLALAPEERVPKDVPVPVLFRNVWDLSRIVTLDTYRDIWRAQIRRAQTEADPRPPTYPGCFVLSGMQPSTDLEADLRSMNPILEVWRHAPLTPGTKGGVTPTPNPITPGLIEASKSLWEKIETVDLRDLNNGKVRVDKLPVPANGFRFTATLPSPAKGELDAVIVMVRPRGAKQLPPDWKPFSTLNDSSPSNLNKIYNLQPFVEQLISDEVTDPAPVATAVFTHK